MVHERFGRATPPTRAMVAMAAVLALLLGAVVTAGRAGADDEWTVTAGHVDWGVKASFRSYVTGPGGGTASADAGATVNGDGTFRFPASGGTASADGGSVAASTAGAVHFSAHAGALAIDLWDLRVQIDGTSGTLVADASSTPLSGGLETYDDVAVATLDLSAVTPTDDGTTRTWAAVPATMHADGVGIFDSYPEGTALDPVTVVVELEAPATTSTTEAPTTTTTEAPTTTTTEAPTTTTTEAPGTGVAVTGGHLDWGVKASFRNYVVGPVAGGSVTTAGGASAGADGTYRFPATGGSATTDGSSFDATFGGSVRFTGHGGELDLYLTGLEVRADGDSGVLVADVTSHALGAAGAESHPDVELAALDLSGVTPGSVDLAVTWSDIAAALTEAGAPAFGGFYAAGEALDPLTVVLDVDSTTVPTVPIDPSGPPASVDRASYAPGDELTVTGRGFLPGEQVEVWLHSDPQWVGTAVAGADGTVVHTFTLPADLEAGQHHVELVGATSGLVLETAEFTVVAADGATAVTGSATLPYTGSDDLPLAAGGLVLLVAGSALTALTVRRSRAGGPVG